MPEWPWKWWYSVAVQSGTLLHALRVQLKRRVSARRGGDYNEVPQAIQKKSRPFASNCVTPFACELSSERGYGFRKANVVECRMFACQFPSDKVQNEVEIRGSTPVSANDWGKNTAPWPYSLRSLSIGPLWSYCVPCSSESSFLVRSWYSLLTAFCLFSRVAPGIVEVLS